MPEEINSLLRKVKIAMQFDIVSFFLLFTSLGNLFSTSIRKIASSVCSSILAESQVPNPGHHGNYDYKRWYTRSNPKVRELWYFVLVSKSIKPDTKG